MTKKQRDKVLKELKNIKTDRNIVSWDELPGNCGAMIWFRITRSRTMNSFLEKTKTILEAMIKGGYNTCLCSVAVPEQMNNKQVEKLKSLGWKESGMNISSRHHQVGDKRRIKYFILLLSNKDREEIGTKLFGMNRDQAIDPDGERIDLHGDDFYNDDW